MVSVSCWIFQSTLPAREATFLFWSIVEHKGFQSTLPAREATLQFCSLFDTFIISIHASREGSDIPGDRPWDLPWDFNPRFPRGKRPSKLVPLLSTMISIHASREGSDHHQATVLPCTVYFNPRFPRGKRPFCSRVFPTAT